MCEYKFCLKKLIGCSHPTYKLNLLSWIYWEIQEITDTYENCRVQSFYAISILSHLSMKNTSHDSYNVHIHKTAINLHALKILPGGP